MAAKDYFRILGIHPESSIEEIKEAYQRKARKFRPGTGNGDVVKLKEVHEAYEALYNPVRKTGHVKQDARSSESAGGFSAKNHAKQPFKIENGINRSSRNTGQGDFSEKVECPYCGPQWNSFFQDVDLSVPTCDPGFIHPSFKEHFKKSKSQSAGPDTGGEILASIHAVGSDQPTPHQELVCKKYLNKFNPIFKRDFSLKAYTKDDKRLMEAEFKNSGDIKGVCDLVNYRNFVFVVTDRGFAIVRKDFSSADNSAALSKAAVQAVSAAGPDGAMAAAQPAGIAHGDTEAVSEAGTAGTAKKEKVLARLKEFPLTLMVMCIGGVFIHYKQLNWMAACAQQRTFCLVYGDFNPLNLQYEEGNFKEILSYLKGSEA